jgi:hypothetical protein
MSSVRPPFLLRAALLVSLVWIALHEVQAIFAPSFAASTLFHRWAHVVVLFVGAASCLTASRRAGHERLAWTLIGLGILGWAGGEAWYTTVLWNDASPPIPSPSDFGYLLLPPLVLAGLALLLRGRKGHTPADAVGRRTHGRSGRERAERGGRVRDALPARQR